MKKSRGVARHPPANAVFEARRAAVLLTQERDRTVQALRHSNAVAVYMLSLVNGEVRIPLDEYKKLVDDDLTTMKINYEGNDAVVCLAVAMQGRALVGGASDGEKEIKEG